MFGDQEAALQVDVDDAVPGELFEVVDGDEGAFEDSGGVDDAVEMGVGVGEVAEEGLYCVGVLNVDCMCRGCTAS